MQVKITIKKVIKNLLKKITIYRKTKNEVNKFKDKKRIEIYRKVQLTKEQKRAIDCLYKTHYGKKIPYIWHQYYTAYTGNFDATYFPELLFIPKFEYYMNRKVEYAKVFQDKNILPFIAKSAGIKMPRTLFSCVEGIIKNSNNEQLTKDTLMQELFDVGECFIKPTIDSSSGVGCQVLKIEKGIDEISGKAICDILLEKGNNWAIQERMKCHESIERIYSGSVNTFRIMTYIFNDEIISVPVIMRIGQGGSYLDNAHAGGMFIAIEDDGRLHETAFTEFNQQYQEHPDTKLIFEGYKVEKLPDAIEAAKKMHLMIPQVGCVNWDFTINEEGAPVLIEANLRGGSIWLFQMAWGKGAFGNRTEDILKWIKEMEES